MNFATKCTVTFILSAVISTFVIQQLVMYYTHHYYLGVSEAAGDGLPHKCTIVDWHREYKEVCPRVNHKCVSISDVYYEQLPVCIPEHRNIRVSNVTNWSDPRRINPCKLENSYCHNLVCVDDTGRFITTPVYSIIATITTPQNMVCTRMRGKIIRVEECATTEFVTHYVIEFDDEFRHSVTDTRVQNNQINIPQVGGIVTCWMTPSGDIVLTGPETIPFGVFFISSCFGNIVIFLIVLSCVFAV